MLKVTLKVSMLLVASIHCYALNKYKYYPQHSLKICITIWYFLQAENFTQKLLTLEVYHSGHSESIFLGVTLNIHMT